jgi:hypothetical protein
LLPSCSKIDESGGEPGAPLIYAYECVAYHGDEADVLIRGNPSALITGQNRATQRTSRAIALAVLPGRTS